MDEPQGDGVTFVCAPAPVIAGVRRVSVRVPWRLHLSQQVRGGRVGEQEQQETEVKRGGGWERGKKRVTSNKNDHSLHRTSICDD